MSLDEARILPAAGAKASFAAIAFVLVIVIIFALDRIGAPDALVVALGPSAALLGMVTIGIMARARNLYDFLVGRREAPVSYAGLAFAATVGGFALAFTAPETATEGMPWRGVVVGFVIAALVVAPRWRAEQASAIADVFATHFPSVFTRAAFAILTVACGWALAAAGLGYAALSVRDAFGVSENAAISICATAVALTLAPGGLRSLIWADAASAGAGLITIGVFIALAAREDFDPFARFAGAAQALQALPAAPFINEIAAACSAASLFAFVFPAVAVASAGAARRAGFVGLAVLALGGTAAAALGDLPVRTPSESALAGLVAFLPAMALARAGLFAASRAFGIDLADAHARLSVLASRRIASARVAILAGAGIAAMVARASPHPSAPLYLALGLWLALAAPSLALTVIPGRTSLPAIAALVSSVGSALVARRFGFGNPSFGPDLLAGALGAGMVGVAAGLITRVLAQGRPAALLRADPFVDLPLDA